MNLSGQPTAPRESPSPTRSRVSRRNGHSDIHCPRPLAGRSRRRRARPGCPVPRRGETDWASDPSARRRCKIEVLGRTAGAAGRAGARPRSARRPIRSRPDGDVVARCRCSSPGMLVSTCGIDRSWWRWFPGSRRRDLDAVELGRDQSCPSGARPATVHPLRGHPLRGHPLRRASPAPCIPCAVHPLRRASPAPSSPAP